MKFLFLFLDGIGLGADDPETNPFVRAKMPTLHALLGGQSMVASSAPHHGERVSLLSLDASLGVDGLPQSATGQAALLTGINIPAEIGYHYGPKPNADVRQYLLNGDSSPQRAHYPDGHTRNTKEIRKHWNGTIFSWLRANNKTAALLSAYPEGYFKGIDSGKRLYSAIPLAVTEAELPLFTAEDFYAGRALSADITGEGWRRMLKDENAPVLSPEAAGANLVELATQYDFSFFEYWASDYAGHRQDLKWAVKQLEDLDGILAGLLDTMPDDLLVLLTSDHGNMEDISTRRHTDAKVPGLLIGTKMIREKFMGKNLDGVKDLTNITPAIKRIFS
ncbi:MAG: alkaline phosphatase family protein [Anaerolineae bacterium]|nr:alkaline phosphatase family protein [Anaerolineae bacterium]